MFYPGSKQQVKTFDTGSPLPEISNQEQFDVGQGRNFNVGGKIVEFFPIGVLADALNRKTVTIRKWETEGVIPKASFLKPSKNKDVRGQRRIYTKEQIMGLRRIAREEGVLEPSANGKWKDIAKTDFATKARELFVQLGG
jgi:hypothetical protein